MATANKSPFPPVPIQTPLLDEKAASGVSWAWLQWFLQLNNFFSQIARAVVTSFAGRVGAILPQAGDYPPSLGGTGQSDWQAGDLLIGAAGISDTVLLPVGPAGSVLTSDPANPDAVNWKIPASALVTSVFGRAGTVTAVPGDYGPSTGGTGQTAWVKGNLLVGQAVNVTGLLAPGPDTSLIMADSTMLNGVKWANNLVWISASIATITANYTTLSTDFTLLANATGGNINVTLDNTAARIGQVYIVKKLDATANTVTLTPSSGTIEGAATQSTGTQFVVFRAQFDGTNWWLL